MRTHGLYSTYRTGCRCDPCTDANTERVRQQIDKREPKQDQHGLATTFTNYGCRCEACTEAQQAKVRRRYSRNRPAPKSRQQWTTAELEYITAKQSDGRRYLHSAYECAVALGRTVCSVDTQRHLCRTDPTRAQLRERAVMAWVSGPG